MITNKIKHTILLSFFFTFIHTYSQDIKINFSHVKEEKCTNVLDQNGNPCALIKIITSQDLVFDVGMLGILKSDKTETGYNLYVPAGVKRISISKHGLETLRNKDLGMSTQKGAVYSMIVKTSLDKIYQYVNFKIKPSTAIILIESTDINSKFSSESLQDASGYVTTKLPIGNYKYTAIAGGYIVEKSTFNLTEQAPRTIKIEMQKVQTSLPSKTLPERVIMSSSTTLSNTNLFKQRFGARLVLQTNTSTSFMAVKYTNKKIMIVQSVIPGKAFNKAGILSNFIIESINNKPISSMEDLQNFENESTLFITGHYPDTKDMKAKLKLQLKQTPEDKYFKNISYTVNVN